MRSARGHLVRLIAGALVTVAVAAACIPPRPSPSPTSTPLVATASPASPAPAESSAAPAGVVVDPALLKHLPADVGGVPLMPDAESAEAIAADGSIAPFVSAIALASAFGPAATDAGGDYVVVTVARLRPNTFGDAFFRGWRDTFDEAVCQQAGGVQGNAEAEIGGRPAYIGTCAGGVHTYHVHLPESDVIVSMQGIGERRFAERVVAGLTE